MNATDAQYNSTVQQVHDQTQAYRDTLAFTGLDVVYLAVICLALLALGIAIRKASENA